MCECTYNFIQWKNSVRTMIFAFRFCSVLGKTCVIVRFVVAGFRIFPISIFNMRSVHALNDELMARGHAGKFSPSGSLIFRPAHTSKLSRIPDKVSWRRSIVVRTLVSAGEVSPSCANLLAGWVTTLRLSRPLSVSQYGQLSHPSLRGR